MAYHFDNWDNALVIDGWEKGIADSELQGISDMRNVNIISVPGEASVNFATAFISPPTITGTKTVTGLSSNAISFSGITGFEAGMAIQFTSVGSLSGVSTNTTYWIHVATGSPTTSVTLYSDYNFSSAVTITGSAGGATFTIFNVGSTTSNSTPQYFTNSPSDVAAGGLVYRSFMQDGIGQVWSNTKLTTSGFWTFTGMSGTSDTSAGCGLIYYAGYVFAFRQASIDYFTISTNAWTYGWNWLSGTTHNGANACGLHNTGVGHEALVAPDNVCYFVDGNWIECFFQTDPGTAFDPTNLAGTYTANQLTALIPNTDSGTALGYIGDKVLAGGIGNIIYSFNRTNNLSATGQPLATWIILPEFNTHRMVTINTNTYIFAGNRGRIYATNGTNAALFKKLPDHISGTIEPYFQWGGATTVKNQLYFSAICTSNGGTSINQYGGVWAIDMDTEALRLTNQLSYGSYAGFASAMIPVFGTVGHNPGGTGLYIGWSDGSNSNFGIDVTVGTPYTGSQATIDSDLIPIGTFNKTRDATQIEYKLTKPMVSGESIVIKTRLIFDVTSTGYSTTLSDSTVGAYSATKEINFQNAQWVQFQIIVNSTVSSPSYTRLQQIRLLGFTGETLAQSQQLGI